MPVFCETNTPTEKKTCGKPSFQSTPDHEAGSESCCWIAEQRLAQRQCFFTDTGIGDNTTSVRIRIRIRVRLRARPRIRVRVRLRIRLGYVRSGWVGYVRSGPVGHVKSCSIVLSCHNVLLGHVTSSRTYEHHTQA